MAAKAAAMAASMAWQHQNNESGVANGEMA
jgi:hypothetical protein